MEQANRNEAAEKLSAVLVSIADLFGTDPALAESQLADILNAIPGQQQALLLLVCVRRIRADKDGARAILEAMAKASPGLAAVHYELGLVLGASGETAGAVAMLKRAVELEPNHPSAWRALGDALARAGDSAAAGQAYARLLTISLKELELVEGAAARTNAQPGPAENMLRELLNVHRTDVSSMHMLANVDMRLESLEEAEHWLARALELAPAFAAARHDYVEVLDRAMKWSKLLPQLDGLLKNDPHKVKYRGMRAAAFLMIGEYERALEEYEALLADHPEDVYHRIGYGHVLRTIGRHEDAVAAYRRSIELRAGFGSAYQSLANLKTFRFTEADIETMRAQLRRIDLSDDDRYRLYFALGKALEDRQDYAESFENYRNGSAARRMHSRDDPDISTRYVRRCKALFTREFFRSRAGFGCLSPDPIYIVGLPRSGSTLIEQILSSHSAIEGTSELQDVTHLAMRLDENAGKYPDVLGELDRDRFKSLGEEFLERTRIQRKLGRPYFIDKLPNNFEHIGFIQLMLPNSKIIDARRHPLACGCSLFKHDFVRGMTYTYDLTDIGRYYRDYVELMAHFDTVLPGRVHRVFYEDMVRDPEREIRRLLDYCSVPFEDFCLRFYESGRGVRTASSEQVRRPVYTDAIEQWRNYEPWLGPLKAALGPVLELYPAVPAF